MKSFESSFPKDYRKDDIEQVLKFVLAGKFCQLICLPGGGKATVLKLLAYNESVRKFHLGTKERSSRFIYLNLLELPNLDQPTIDKFLILSLKEATIQQFSNGAIPTDPLVLSQQLKNTVHQLITNEPSTILVLLFDHFDEFQNKLPRSFFQTLRSLRSLAKYKFSCIFASRRDLRELVDEELLREFYDFFVGNTVYMKLYDEAAAKFMLAQIEQLIGKKLTKVQGGELISLTGGHTKVLKVCAETVLQESHPADLSLIGKQLVKASLFELWLFLTSEGQRTLLAVSKNEQVQPADAVETLIQFGLLKQFNNSNNASNFRFTIPLFEEFVKTVAKNLPPERFVYDSNTREIKKGQTIVSDLLSFQEYRLLKFLIENQGRTIEREEIVTAVWPEAKTTEGISEAAIDQMIFRLRKKIEDEPTSPKHILTMKGRGFRFVL